MSLCFITGNQNKFLEAKQMLPDLVQLNIQLDEIQSLDPRIIIEHKLKEAAKHHDGPLFVEDSSVFLDCLNGFPGPFIKYLEEKIGDDGIANLAFALKNTRVRALNTIGYMHNNAIQYFEGEIFGTIVAPRGKNGFGWDVILMPDGFSITMAEMSPEQKNKMSMRHIALEKLKAYLEKQKAYL